MRRVCEAACAVALTFAAAVTGVIGHTQTLEDLQRGQPLIFADAVQAYIYGYPLMMFGVTTRTGTTISNPNDRLGGAPLNQFGKEPQLPDATRANDFAHPGYAGPVLADADAGWWTEVSTKSPGTRIMPN